MLNSFTIGRKLIPRENTDDKINMEIENTISGCWFRHLAKAKQLQKTIVGDKKSSVFSSLDLSKRTDGFYQNFAKDSVENDIIKKQK